MAKFIDLDTGLPALLNKVKAWVNGKEYITAEDAAGIVAATGDLVIVEDDNYINIVISQSQVDITPASLALYAAQKSAVIKVSGTHLNNDISISVPTGFTASPSTIAQMGGTVAQTDVTITYTGADASTASGNITATAGDVVKSIPVAYSQYAGPTIIADSTLTVKAAAGQSNTGSLQVTGLNLTAGITATVSGTGFSVSDSENGTYGETASLPSGGGTLYVKFSPTGSTGSTGTLTLASTGATSKTVTLTGSIAGTLSISPASANIGIPSGGSGTAQFTVTGANLTPGSTASVAVSGTGMTVNKNSLTVGLDGTINETVTVTFSGSADSTGQLTIHHNDVATDATASVVGTIATPLPVNASFKVGNIHYKVNDDQMSVRVWNGSSESAEASTKYSGAINIPASVSDSGVTANLDGGGTQAGAGCTYAVTKLAIYAFYRCSGVTSLTLPEGLESISVACLNSMSNSSFTSLTIPSTVTSIGGGFLMNCNKLTTVNMLCAENVNFVDSWGSKYNPQLKNCSALTSFVIPDNITLGRGDNYEGCTAIDTVTIGASAQALNSMFASGFMANVNTIICRGTTPPKINPTSSTSYSIPQSVYERAQVYVPRGYKQAYLDAEDGRAVNGVYPKMWSIFDQYHSLIEYDPD